MGDRGGWRGFGLVVWGLVGRAVGSCALGGEVSVRGVGEVQCRFRLGFGGWLGEQEFDFVQGDAGIVEEIQRAGGVFRAERVAETASYLLDGGEQVGREVVAFEDEDGVFLGQAAEATPGVGVVGGAAFLGNFGHGAEGAGQALEMDVEDFRQEAVQIEEVELDAVARHPAGFRQRAHGDASSAQGREGCDRGLEDEAPHLFLTGGEDRAEAGNVLDDGPDMTRFDVHGGVIGTLKQLVKSKLLGGWVRLSRLSRGWIEDVGGERGKRACRCGGLQSSLKIADWLRAMAHVSVCRAGQFRFLGEVCRIRWLLRTSSDVGQ